MINTLLSKRTLTSIGTCVAGEVLPVLSGTVPRHHLQHYPEEAHLVLHPQPHRALRVHLLSGGARLLPALRQRREDHPVHLHLAGPQLLLSAPV